MKFKDEICTHANCSFDFIDRLRILCHGKASVSIQTKTEHLPGNVQSAADVLVPKIFYFKRRRGALEQKSNKTVEADLANCAVCGKPLVMGVCETGCGRIAEKPPGSSL